jgi:hypothetical protein
MFSSESLLKYEKYEIVLASKPGSQTELIQKKNETKTHALLSPLRGPIPRPKAPSDTS